MSSYLWLDYKKDTSPHLLAARLNQMLNDKKIERRLRRHSLVFLCIGTPKIPGDCLGPFVGSLLKMKAAAYTVFGTMEQPVHALNLKSTLKAIRKKYPGAVIIVIDAALGEAYQNGFLTIKKGALKPGLGLGKNLPAIGHIQITGVFNELYSQNARRQMAEYSLCIARGLTASQCCRSAPSGSGAS